MKPITKVSNMRVGDTIHLVDLRGRNQEAATARIFRDANKLGYSMERAGPSSFVRVERTRSHSMPSSVALTTAKYGMNYEDTFTLYMKHDGCCHICRKWSPRLDVDHCHAKNVVRGFLCNRCNRALSMLGDHYESVVIASDYLRPYAQK